MGSFLFSAGPGTKAGMRAFTYFLDDKFDKYTFDRIPGFKSHKESSAQKKPRRESESRASPATFDSASLSRQSDRPHRRASTRGPPERVQRRRRSSSSSSSSSTTPDSSQPNCAAYHHASPALSPGVHHLAAPEPAPGPEPALSQPYQPPDPSIYPHFPSPLAPPAPNSSLDQHRTVTIMDQEPYFPPPPREDYAPERYNPAKYQPQSDYGGDHRREDRLARQDGPRNDPYASRTTSEVSGGRYARRGDDYGSDDYDDRSSRRRSKSKSRRSSRRSSRSQSRGAGDKIKDAFATGEKGITSAGLGGLAGGVLGHHFGKGTLATVAGAAIGAIGANAWEARHERHDKRKEKGHESGRRSRSTDYSEDSRSRRDGDSYQSRDDVRSSARGSRYDDDYSDEGYDSEDDRRRRKRDRSRRRRDYDDGR